MQIDPLSDVLSLLRPHTYVAGGFDLQGRWSIGFDAHTGIKCYAVLSGHCRIVVDGVADPVALDAGDCVLLPNGRPFALSSDLSLPPVPFTDLHAIEWHGGIATLHGGGETLILGGHFAFAGNHGDLLLGAMPAVVHLSDGEDREELRWALDRMRRELIGGRPGGILVAQHLAHMLLVQTLRLYLAGNAGRHVGWLFALADPQLATAIAAMHAEPGIRWTLPMLAQKAGMSRSTFARTFIATVGSSPIEYLTNWRMLLAGSRLSGGVESVSTIAHALGYDSEAAFSTAFRRSTGRSPRQYARTLPSRGAAHPWSSTALERHIST